MSPQDLARLLAARPHLRVAASTPLRAAAPAHPTSIPRCHPRRRARAGATPHDLLWAAVLSCYPAAQREYERAVPGRKYRLDIALPDQRLAIEVDGWEWHGKHKGDFQRDRTRQNLLTVNNWRILRFTAGEIRKDMDAVMETIANAIQERS